MIRQFFLALIVIFVFTACSRNEVSLEAEPEKVNYFTHTVSIPGESLGIISQWYTGKSSNWMIIQAHNPVLDPRTMRSGDHILIPENLLIRSDSLTEDYVAAQQIRNFARSLTPEGTTVKQAFTDFLISVRAEE